MAVLTLNREKLQVNFAFLKSLFDQREVSWGVVSKLLCGNKLFLQELLNLGIKEVHDSRISNLAMVKRLKKEVQTVYIKPVASKNVGNNFYERSTIEARLRQLQKEVEAEEEVS